MKTTSHDTVPIWAIVVPLGAMLLFGAKLAGVVQSDNRVLLVLAVVMIGASVFAAVHHAEVLALRLGEPFGSILLAIAVTVIEVALIVSILLTDMAGSDAVARDTVFAAVMIVLNGVIGLCLVLGSRRHREQVFQIQAAAATLAVLGTLAVLALVLPNFTIAMRGATYSPVQLAVVGTLSLALYVTFVFVQTVRHREYFLDVAEGAAQGVAPMDLPSNAITIASAVLLILSLAAVILLSKLLSAPLDATVMQAGLPHAIVGVVIAGIVLLPEGIAATKAALANRLQSSMNLALGSAVASIGLTIPTVAVVSLVLDRTLVLGLSAENMVLLVLTLFVSTLTLGTGRTTVLQGAVHLVVFVVFLLLSAIP
jgi:Ca2+:H+ antiporter